MTRRRKLVQRRLRRHEAELEARARILPDVSTRAPSTPSLFVTPIRDAIDAYRQTPEAWASVWEER